MALTIIFQPGETFDLTGDTITLAKLNRILQSGYGTISSGSIETDNIGANQITAPLLATTLDLTGKSVTLPANQDLGFLTSIGSAPAYKGQIAVLGTGEIYIANGTAGVANWILGGAVAVTGANPAAFGTPAFVGQWAIDNNHVTYRAIGTSDSDDWVMMRTKSMDLRLQTSAPGGLADHLRMYAVGSDIYYQLPNGTVNNVTSPFPYVLMTEEQSSGTDAGSSSATTWNPRTLTNEKVDENDLAALSGGQIVLQPGVWRTMIYSTAHAVDKSKARLRDITGNATLLVGSNIDSGGGEEEMGKSVIIGQFTISVVSNIEVQHYTQSAQADDGLGEAVSSGEVEVYCLVELYRVGDV